MADNAHVYTGISKKDDIDYPVLVPNVNGLESAVGIQLDRIQICFH